jgi:hypothetical protein
MASRKRKKGPKPGARGPDAGDAPLPVANPLPPSTGAAGAFRTMSGEAAPPRGLPGDTSRAARREAERRRNREQIEAETARARAAASAGGEAAVLQPAFFFGFTVPRAKLAFARFWIFGLLAVDAFLQLRHAPRYGAGGFNVGQIPIFDGAAPHRPVVGAVDVMLLYLFSAIALGVGSRAIVAVAAVLYGWIYFSSQLDSYQHHYLIALALGLAIAVPWFRPRDGKRADGERPVATWAVRLLLIQLGVLYLWAAIAKMEHTWLDGSALKVSLQHGGVYELIDDTVGFRVASRLVLVAELFLAVAIWVRPLWPAALVVGVGMHVGIAFTNLEIGLFSWLMVALYILVVPDRWFLAAWRALSPARALDALEARVATVPGFAAAIAPLALVVGAIFLAVPVDGAIAGAILGGLAVLAGDAIITRRLAPRAAAGGALAAAAALAVVLGAKTTVVSDYYKFWGGASRRLGDVATARVAYARATEHSDDPWNYYQLGRMLLTTDDGLAVDEPRGRAALHRAQALEPKKARAFTAEARFLAATGRREEALAVARAGAAAEPTDGEARTFVEALAAGGAENPRPSNATPGEPDDEGSP